MSKKEVDLNKYVKKTHLIVCFVLLILFAGSILGVIFGVKTLVSLDNDYCFDEDFSCPKNIKHAQVFIIIMIIVFTAIMITTISLAGTYFDS